MAGCAARPVDLPDTDTDHSDQSCRYFSLRCSSRAYTASPNLTAQKVVFTKTR